MVISRSSISWSNVFNVKISKEFSLEFGIDPLGIASVDRDKQELLFHIYFFFWANYQHNPAIHYHE